MNSHALYATPKEYTIGKKLPPEERITLKLWPLSLKNLHYAIVPEEESMIDRISRISNILADMLRLDEEEFKNNMDPRFLMEETFVEDIMDAITERMGIKDQEVKRTRVKRIHEEQEKKLSEVSNG